MFVDIFMKLSKIGFSMECFAAVYLHFFTGKRQSVAFVRPVGYLPSNRSISRIFLTFSNFQRSQVLSRLATRKVTRTLTFW